MHRIQLAQAVARPSCACSVRPQHRQISVPQAQLGHQFCGRQRSGAGGDPFLTESTQQKAWPRYCWHSDRPQQAVAAFLASGLLCLSSGVAAFEFPNLPGGPPLPSSTFEERTKAFEESEFLRGLKDRTTSNRARNKKEVEDKYCKRQAEMGVGDCAGLRLIPGATKSGKQRTPDWLANILGKGKEVAKEVQDADLPFAGAE